MASGSWSGLLFPPGWFFKYRSGQMNAWPQNSLSLAVHSATMTNTDNDARKKKKKKLLTS